jgi:phage terminase large subunit-like protein
VDGAPIDQGPIEPIEPIEELDEDSLLWSTAVPDWKDRIREGRSLVPVLPLFDKMADKGLRIFKRLRIPDVSGNPTYGEACGQWVFDFVRAVFGSYNPETKRRMLREFFLLVPKKNGKSAIASALAITAVIMNDRPLAEILLIAPTKPIAEITFKQAAGIIALDAQLDKVFHRNFSELRITHMVSKAVIEIKAASPDVVTGSKATYTFLDETHEFATMSKAAAVFVELKGALASRKEGFFLQISTQSKEPPAGVFKSELETARAVRDGELRLPLLAVIYELPEEMAKDGGWRKEENWALVNPNLDRSVDRKFLRDELKKADREGPAKLALIASQHFNVEVGLGLKSQAWTGALYWEGAGDATLSTLEELMSRCEVATVGVDGGGLDDLMGLAVLGRERGSKKWLHWGRAWVHPVALETRPEIAPRLLDFAEQGDLVICDDATQDLRDVADICETLFVAGLLPKERALGLDPYAIGPLVDELASRGMTGTLLEGIRQGAALSPAQWTLERKLKDKTVLHGARPLMAWVVSNAKVEQRQNAVLISKQVAGRAKIDPLVALLNAAMLMQRNPQASGNIGDFLSGAVMAMR